MVPRKIETRQEHDTESWQPPKRMMLQDFGIATRRQAVVACYGLRAMATTFLQGFQLVERIEDPSGQHLQACAAQVPMGWSDTKQTAKRGIGWVVESENARVCRVVKNAYRPTSPDCSRSRH